MALPPEVPYLGQGSVARRLGYNTRIQRAPSRNVRRRPLARQAADPVPQRRIAPSVIAGVLVLAFVLQCLASMRQQSATFDEPVYVAASYVYLELGDFRLKRDAPPLMKALVGTALRLGSYLGNGSTFDAQSELQKRESEYQFAEQFFAGATDPHRTLQIARLPVVLIGAVLAVYLFLFGRLLFGEYGTLLPLFLFCFDPNMIAHARVVSADLTWSAFFFIAHYYLYRLLTEEGRWNLVGLSVAAALAVAAKFSGLLVLPSLALVGGLAYARPSILPLVPARGTVADQRRRLLRVGAIAAIVCAIVTWLAVCLLYQTSRGAINYYVGIRSIYDNGVPDFKFYLLGQFNSGSSWYYYPAAILLKTPDVTLALVATSVVAACLPGLGALRGIWLLGPAALVLLVSSQDPVTIGLRRVIAVYPFLFLWIGERCTRIWELWSSASQPSIARLRWAALTLVVAAGVLSAVQIHPYQLAYFNRLVGGPDRGPMYLDDSNIDWGQDLPGLAAWQSAQNVRPLVLWYFGTDDPKSYGIDYRRPTDQELVKPERTAYAISANVLVGLRLTARDRGRPELDWMTRFRPAAKIGYSIYVYDFR